ncbi:MAG: hypothetical protein FJ288_18205 [Planctomycetes bacterium]|nr:hypothetical protein [Planctomycetota bacterium]
MCNPMQCRYLAQASHLVAACDRDGALRAVEAASAACLGYGPADLAGKTLADLVPAPDRPHLARLLQRCGTGQPVWDELALATACGAAVRMLCCFQRLAGPGDRDGLLVTGLRLGSAEAIGHTHTAAVLGRLALRCHGPAHRLMAAFEALRAQSSSREAAERCRAELDGLLEVLSQSVTVGGMPSTPFAGHARVVAGKDAHANSGAGMPPADARPGAVDAVAVVAAALRLADGDPEFRGLDVALRPERAAVWAWVHPVGLAFLALQLARWACDATSGRMSPRLRVDVYEKDGRVVLEFADNGGGRRREDVAGAGPPFVKRGGAGEAAGLGLMTCAELVRFMGGTMRVLARPGGGATVVVALPAARPARA